MVDERIMHRALAIARVAADRGEVPVGAVLVDAGGRILAEKGNDCIHASDPVGHAEIRVLREAGKKIQNYRILGSTLYVTLEPCAMCATALVHARVSRLVFGATDPKAGAIISKYQIGTDSLLNHRFDVCGGILAEECSRLLREFFRQRR